MADLHAVTGAFGYSGSYIARRLLDLRHAVVTLTNTPPDGHPLERRVRASPLDFRRPDALRRALEGVRVLHNTYWVRFDNPPHFTFASAVEKSRRLFEAAAEAGVERIVHVSITNPSPDSDLPYFRGKAEVERLLDALGIPHAVLRPTVLFGPEGILVNNIAWALRRLPVFGLPGSGEYRLQPIHVGDLADLAVAHAAGTGNVVVEAIGPETYTYRELVRTVGDAIGCRRPLVPLPPPVVRGAAALIGKVVGDVVLTPDEIRGLMDERLYVDAPPAGTTRLSRWAREHGDRLGRAYLSELARRRAATRP